LNSQTVLSAISLFSSILNTSLLLSLAIRSGKTKPSGPLSHSDLSPSTRVRYKMGYIRR
jgi:hypothetical protein